MRSFFQPEARWWRKVRSSLTLLATLSLSMATAANAETNGNSADALKAAYLFNFAKFTSWPRVDDLDISVQFCVSKDSLSDEVFDGWGMKQVQKRPVRVTFFEAVDEYQLTTCSIIFVGEEQTREDLSTIFDLAEKSSILVVSDRPGFSAQGGHIELYLADRKLRFKVNLNAITDADLSLGAGLLRLAEIVDTTEAR